MARMILHVGAHKTATTYLQNRLDKNQDVLVAAGIHYPHIFQTRRNFTYRMNQPTDNRNAFTRDLVARHRAGTHILLSDENFIGGVDDVMALGRQYGHAREKLEKYLALVESDSPEIFISVRDYASFAISLYCEYLRHFPYVSFADYYSHFKASGFSWVDTLSDILAASPGAKVTVWDFARFRELEPQVITAITGLEASALAALGDNARDSFSETTIRCIDALSSVLDFENLKKAAEDLAKTFPKGKDHPKFNPLSLAETVALTEAYVADLARIAALSDRLVMLG